METMDDQLEDELQDEPIAVDLTQLTPCARQTLDRASDEAQRMGDPYVGTDHVLLAMVSIDTAAAKRVLEILEIDADRLSGTMRFIRGTDNPPSNGGVEYPYSPRLQRVLESAAKDAVKRSHGEIGTLHLLSGMLKERSGLAVFLLESPGVGLEKAGGAIARAHRDGIKDE
jgi:ATP-dependent Clp protease ATP-binding subunit ClpA